MLPDRLTQIDDVNRGDHYFLDADDRCFFFGEYFSGKGFSGGPTNQLIHNFKIKPSILTANSARRRYKDEAIREIASGLRKAIPADLLPGMTFVPIPPSKIPGHVDYCDRSLRSLMTAFGGLGVDIRELLVQTASADADHESNDRISIEDLSDIVAVDQASLQKSVRETVVLFDDVLTSGKHFKVCCRKIRAILPAQNIIGIFVARCVHPNPFEDSAAE